MADRCLDEPDSWVGAGCDQHSDQTGTVRRWTPVSHACSEGVSDGQPGLRGLKSSVALVSRKPRGSSDYGDQPLLSQCSAELRRRSTRRTAALLLAGERAKATAARRLAYARWQSCLTRHRGSRRATPPSWPAGSCRRHAIPGHSTALAASTRPEAESGLSRLRPWPATAAFRPVHHERTGSGHLYRKVPITLCSSTSACIEWPEQGCPRPGSRPSALGTEKARYRVRYKSPSNCYRALLAGAAISRR